MPPVRRVIHRVHGSPIRSPRRLSTSLRKKALIKKLNGEVQFGAASKANLKVVVRVRPQNQREQDNGARCVVQVVDEHMLVFDPKEEEEGFFFKGVRQQRRDLNKRQPREQKFIFERVFGEESTNEELYQATAHNLLDALLGGYNCSVFAYGATGAGKTYTMLGKPDCPGITSLTLQELYNRIEQVKGERTCEVAMSYIEVYNEMVRDLLRPGKPLNVQERGQQVLVPGLSLHKPRDAEELMQMLAQGNQNRSQHATDANAESSRSHAVFQIFVRQQEWRENTKANVTISKLSMIDLAGSERGAATGFSGARFREGTSINKSLLALGNCINALADGHRHIPYRDSKLTRLLKDSLGGNCRSVMIATVSPASTSFEDSFNTLRYANRAKTIKTTVKKNIMNVDQHVSNYIKIMEDLREEVCSLKEKVKQYESKEQEWMAQQAVTAESSTQPPQVTPQEREELEGKIAALEERLKDKDAAQQEQEVSEEEMEAQSRLRDVSLEQKALRWELLQLEASIRSTELKLHHWTTRLARIKVIAFTSHKLDKSLSKCERTIHSLNKRLSQTTQCWQTVQAKLNANFAKMQLVCNNLNQWGSEPDQPSKHSQGLIEQHKANIAVRDSYQLGEHLRQIVKEEFQEQFASEQLVRVLLNTAKEFYLQLRVNNQCSHDVEQIHLNMVESMDECRIAWADQQNMAEEEGERPSAELMQLDLDHFAQLPSLAPVHVTPTAPAEPSVVFRKSSMRPSISTSPQPLQPSEARVSAFTLHTPVAAPSTPLSTTQPTSDTVTPPMSSSEEEMDNVEENLATITESPVIPSSPVLSSRGSAVCFKSLREGSLILPNTTPAKSSHDATFAISPAMALETIDALPDATFALAEQSPKSDPIARNNTKEVSTGLAGPQKHVVGGRVALDSTFNIELDLPPEDDSPPPSGSPRVVREPSPGGKITKEELGTSLGERGCTQAVEVATSRSPLQPLHNKARPSIVITSSATAKVPPTKSLASKKGMSHTPHKFLGQRGTPVKGSVWGRGGESMRRSVSTPSLAMQVSTAKTTMVSPTAKRKLKGLGGALHKSTSFLRGKTNSSTAYQENVPPPVARRALTTAMQRAPSPRGNMKPALSRNP